MALRPKDQLDRFMAPVYRLARSIIAKALIGSVTDSTNLQTVKLSIMSEEFSGVERVQNYGFTSRPDEGAQAVVVFVGGRRDNPLVVACDDGRQRLELDSAGEVAMYSKFGSKIVLKADGSIEATPASGKAFKVNGDIDASGDVIAGPTGTRVHLLTHIHPTPAGPSSAPTATPT